MADPMEDSGSISPAGRFARMEAALERIETKLDLKADVVALNAIDARLKYIEENGSPESREALGIARALKDHVSDLESGRAMSPQTQEYIKVFQQHTADIADLKRDALIKETQITTAKESADAVADARFAQMKFYVTVVSIVSGLAVAVSSAITVLSLFHVIK